LKRRLVAECNHPLIEPWARERLSSKGFHQDTINRLGLTIVPLGFRWKEKIGIKRQNDFLLPLPGEPLNLFSC